MADADEIILKNLDDAALVEQMHQDLYDGLKDEVVEGVNILLGRGWASYKVLTESLVAIIQAVTPEYFLICALSNRSNFGQARYELRKSVLRLAKEFV